MKHIKVKKQKESDEKQIIFFDESYFQSTKKWDLMINSVFCQSSV